MILTDEQLESTRTWIARFEESLEQARLPADAADAPLRKVYAASFSRQLDDLRSQVAEYEALRSGAPLVFQLTSLTELPIALIKGRIASGLTQAELAERLGVEVSRVEHDEETAYEAASLVYLIDVAAALSLSIGTQITLSTRAAKQLLALNSSKAVPIQEVKLHGR
jgi:hypothetical protein